MDDFNGFVIYSKKDESFIPFGVTSSNSEFLYRLRMFAFLNI